MRCAVLRILDDTGQVAATAESPGLRRSGVVHLGTVQGGDSLSRLLAHRERPQRLVHCRDLGRGAEDVTSSLEPLVIDVDRDACHDH